MTRTWRRRRRSRRSPWTTLYSCLACLCCQHVQNKCKISFKTNHPPIHPPTHPPRSTKNTCYQLHRDRNIALDLFNVLYILGKDTRGRVKKPNLRILYFPEARGGGKACQVQIFLGFEMFTQKSRSQKCKILVCTL